MSVTVANSEGVTVLTLTADPNSACPPLCQILNGLCCSPRCCTASQQLKENQGTSQSLLGTLHILAGLLNILLSVILCAGGRYPWPIRESYFPFWIGGMYILIGAMCVWSERRPSPCLVILNVHLNIVGLAFAVAAIVLYSQSLADLYIRWICERDYYSTESPWQKLFEEKCREKMLLTEWLLRCIIILLIILSVMELCVSVSSAVLGIKALRNSSARENKSNEDPEQCTPLLAEASGDPTP
ncbi:unnamed protein product [Tetraodon nigroviridis]|uniref:(spotted green pufferfish) hypothetical protein n=1 Tax=Tetraodon nigroviridis TaxID=99883 RepID=Q4TAI3_TETNG|nr:unnamed protein product [Tetraodon nigroviridis]